MVIDEKKVQEGVAFIVLSVDQIKQGLLCWGQGHYYRRLLVIFI
jgi:hypothetical protein